MQVYQIKTDYDLKIKHVVPSERKAVQEFCNRVMNRVYDWLEQSTPKTDARVTQVLEDARCIEAELKELHEYIGVLCETSVGADGTRMDNLEEFQFQQALEASIAENVDKDSISNESQASEPSEDTEASDDSEAVITTPLPPPSLAVVIPETRSSQFLSLIHI